MFNQCSNATFMVNSVFKFPLLQQAEVDKNDVFYRTFYNLGEASTQTRSALSIINNNQEPSSSRQTFTNSRCFADVLATAVNWGGTGVEGADDSWYIEDNDTLYISTAGQLAVLAYYTNNGNNFQTKTIILLNDIDLRNYGTGEDSTTSFNGGNGWNTIGTNSNPFRGTFDGANHSISNLYIRRTTSPAYAGLFYLMSGTVKNLHIASGKIEATGSYVGAITPAGSGTIENCSNRASVSGSSTIGGITGSLGAAGQIINCVNYGDISAGGYVGGIAGESRGRVERCFNEGNIGINGSGSGNTAGGIVGNSYDALVNLCVNSGSVTGVNNVGGIVGRLETGTSTIANSYNSGAITGELTALDYGTGGVVGNVQNSSNLRIINCFNTGSVSDPDIRRTGGVVGRLYQGTVSYCYYDTLTIGTVNPPTNAIGARMIGVVGDSVKGLATMQMIGLSALTNMIFADTVAGVDTLTPAERWTLKDLDDVIAERKRATFYPQLTVFAESDDAEVVAASIRSAIATSIPLYALLYDANGGEGNMPEAYGISGETATVAANTFTRNGYTFEGWATTSAGSVAYAPETVLTFDTADITLFAVWQAIPYSVSVINGTGSGEYIVGATVTITANTPPAEQRFKNWTTESTGVIFVNANSATTTFTMPANAVTVTANYDSIPPTPPTPYSVTVTNGTGSGEYAEGDTVTIVANTPPNGQQFKNWTTTSAGVIFANATIATTTFIMPANAVTVTANYEAIPSPPTSVSSIATNPLKAWASNGTLHVSGLTEGKAWAVYSIAGSLIYQGIAGSEQESVTLNVSAGVYVVVQGRNSVKVIVN